MWTRREYLKGMFAAGATFGLGLPLGRAREPGLFMYHCHNLEHEDGGMMRNFRVS